MKHKFLKILGSVFGAALFLVAIWVLRHTLRNIHYSDVILQLHAIPYYKLLLSLLCTVVCYLLISCYDLLALHYVKFPLKYSRVLFTSFITYAISHNIGLAFITGGSLRLRLYSAFGLSTLQITRLMGFGIITFWLSYMTAGSVLFLSNPLAIPAGIKFPLESTHSLGVIFLCFLVVFWAWIFFFRKSLKISGWILSPPTFLTAITQMTLGVVDWASASFAIYILLPNSIHIGFTHVMGVYMLSQIAGLASNVPGGLGVFDSVFILLMGSVVDMPALVGALLMFRIIYYLIPLTGAALSLGAFELSRPKISPS